MVYPTNVIYQATECNNKNHSAAFPDNLPEWFIKLFTDEHDTVLDPFMGSGTTGSVSRRMGRNAIGMEIIPQYYDLAKTKLESYKSLLFEEKVKYETKNSRKNRRIR